METIDYIENLRRLRSQYELSWYVCYKAYQGEHFIFYDRKQGRLTRFPMRPLYNPIPEIKKQVNSLVNLLTYPKLKAIVLPKLLFYSQEEEFKASYLFEQLFFDYLEKYRLQIRQALLDALIYPVSFLGINTVGNDIEIYNLDVFDVVFDPRYPFEKQKRIAKIIRMSKDIAKKKYNLKEKDLEGDVYDYKSLIEQEEFSKKSEVVLYEIEEKRDGGLEISLVTPVGKVLKKDFYEEIDFFTITPIHLSLEKYYYHPSFVEDLIPLQRSLDLMQLRIEDFLLKFTKGTWLVREGTDFELTDESGVIVKWDGAEAPVFQGIPNLTNAPFVFLGNQMSLLERYGVSALTFGKPPKQSNIRASSIISSIISQEIKNKQIEFDNYVYALEELVKKMSFYLSSLWKIPEKRYEVYFVSEDTLSAFKEAYNNIIGIPKRLDNFKIGIDIDFGTNDEERKQIILAMAQYGVLKDPRIIFKYLAPYKAKELILEMTKEQTLLQNPEIQALMQDKETPDEVKEALKVLFSYLAQKYASNPNRT
ncbi:MAG: hypothetical protein QXX45_03265 [Candidatus Aenigmatarchaeota archaeon]